MLKVLVVDDDKLVRLGLINLMPWGKYKMQVVADAPNGTKALDFVKNNKVDLVLLDLEMPGMFGMELLKHLKSYQPDLHCVILTMHQEFTYIQDALRLGVLDYIIKTELSEDKFEEILSRISNRIMAQNQQEEAIGVEQQETEIQRCIKQAVQLLEKEKSEHYSSADMAQKVNMSRSYFCTCFKQIMGYSFNDYLKMIRMEYAKELLINSNRSIAWIAAESSYPNEKYFASVFKSYTGMTPSEFRRK